MKQNLNAAGNSYIISKSNTLIEARYHLSLQQQRLILVLASQIHPHDSDFQEYTFDVQYICRLIGIDQDSDENYYSELQKATMGLIEKGLQIKEGDRLMQTAWLAGAKYHEGKISLTFSQYLKPYLLQLQQCFTRYRLAYILRLRSKYAVRLYEVAKKNQLLGRYYYDLPTLRDILGVNKDELSLWGHFRTRALDKAIEEINAKTDVDIKYTVKKDNKRIVGVTLIIAHNNNHNVDTIDLMDTPIAELVDLLPNRYQQVKGIINILMHACHKYGFEYCKRNILYSNEKANKNYSSFLSMALRYDWARIWWEEQNKEEYNNNTTESNTIDYDHAKETIEQNKRRIVEILSELKDEEIDQLKQNIIRENKLNLYFDVVPDHIWQAFILESSESDNRA